MGFDQLATSAVFLLFVGFALGLMFAPYIFRLK